MSDDPQALFRRIYDLQAEVVRLTADRDAARYLLGWPRDLRAEAAEARVVALTRHVESCLCTAEAREDYADTQNAYAALLAAVARIAQEMQYQASINEGSAYALITHYGKQVAALVTPGPVEPK